MWRWTHQDQVTQSLRGHDQVRYERALTCISLDLAKLTVAMP